MYASQQLKIEKQIKREKLKRQLFISIASAEQVTAESL